MIGSEVLSLYYKEYKGNSDILMVFLHGGGVSSWMWDKQIEYFKKYNCITIDLPEHGLSNNDMEFSIKDTAEEVIKLIEEKNKGKQVILIGFSLGAQIVIEILSKKPDLINKAIINSALINLTQRYSEKIIRYSVKLSFPLIKLKWFSKLQSKTLYIGKDNFEKYYNESSQIKMESLIRILKENMSFQLPKDFKKVNTNILVTIGEKEKSIIKRSAREIIGSNSNCKGIIIPKVGHGAPLALPSLFNAMVDKWICKGVLPKEFKIIK